MNSAHESDVGCVLNSAAGEIRILVPPGVGCTACTAHSQYLRWLAERFSSGSVVGEIIDSDDLPSIWRIRCAAIDVEYVCVASPHDEGRVYRERPYWLFAVVEGSSVVSR